MFRGHHYVHHQELESIIQIVAACGIWCFGFQVVGMVWSWGLCVRFAGCCFNTLELLIMGITVPKTCWARNKICNKYHLLHLVGILFPHISNLVLKQTRKYKPSKKGANADKKITKWKIRCGINLMAFTMSNSTDQTCANHMDASRYTNGIPLSISEMSISTTNRSTDVAEFS